MTDRPDTADTTPAERIIGVAEEALIRLRAKYPEVMNDDRFTDDMSADGAAHARLRTALETHRVDALRDAEIARRVRAHFDASDSDNADSSDTPLEQKLLGDLDRIGQRLVLISEDEARAEEMGMSLDEYFDDEETDDDFDDFDAWTED